MTIHQPLYILFSKTITPDAFAALAHAMFEPTNKTFNLWGSLIKPGATKVHVYAVDKLIWHPLMMEIKEKHIVVVYDNGCDRANIKRLIDNVRTHLGQPVEAWVGDKRFEETE